MRRTVPTVSALLVLTAGALAADKVPDWAQPGSATHVQVAPPADFHRPTTTSNTPIGVFEAQSDIGSAVVPGSASYAANSYTIKSAGYNIWYTRDEFRYLWKKMSGDVSLSADVSFPNPGGYSDRKVVLVIRQDLDDDSKEAMVALHGAGLIHLADRPDKGALIKEDFKIPASTLKRIGIEKHGDQFTLFVGGVPAGAPVTLHVSEPFYVGIGFCSHLPDTSDTAMVSNVVLDNAAGKVH
jgi:hypothetical protein